MTTTPRLALAFVCCSLLAGEQHITIQTPYARYTASADDSLPQAMNTKLLPVLSPLTDSGPPLNPYLTAVANSGDKIMLSPKLEDCQHGQSNCPPTIANDAFLRNARTNLEKGREQVQNLQQERLPQSLEPVRRFLLDNLTTTVRMEEARYEYLATGKTAPLAGMLNQYCTTSQPELMRKLEGAADAQTRWARPWAVWYNTVLQCYRVRAGKYPEDAWKQFVKEFHVEESSTLLE